MSGMTVKDLLFFLSFTVVHLVRGCRQFTWNLSCSKDGSSGVVPTGTFEFLFKFVPQLSSVS